VTYGQAATVCPQCGSAAAVRSIAEWAAMAQGQAAGGQLGPPWPGSAPAPAPQPGYPSGPGTQSGFPDPAQYQSGFPDPDQYQQSGFPDPAQHQQSGFPDPAQHQQSGFPDPANYQSGFPDPSQNQSGFPDPAQEQSPGSQPMPSPSQQPGYPAGERPGQQPAHPAEPWPDQPPPRRSGGWDAGRWDTGRWDSSGGGTSFEDGIADVVLGAATRALGRAISRRMRRTIEERVLPAVASKQEAMLRERAAIAERHPDLRACLNDQVVFLAGGTRVLPLASALGVRTIEQSDALVAQLQGR
jgi:hypothetical protein